MKAWQFEGVHQPLSLNEVPEPVPGPGEVVVDVVRTGMCHSDVGALESEDFVPFAMPIPLTMGHEIAGVVADLGTGVTAWSRGDRVAVLLGDVPFGIARDGGYAPKVLVAEVDLVKIPDGVSFEHAAVATDAGVTSYLGVVTAGQVTTGSKVGIIGFGGLGQLGAQVAIARGAQVFVAEPKQDTWDSIRSSGAVRVVADVAELADEQLDVVVDFAGFGTTTAGAIRAVRPGGRVVQIGLGRQEATIDIWMLVAKNVTLIGALGGKREHLEGVLELFAAGKLTPLITTVDFGDTSKALDSLARGAVQGRIVVSVGGPQAP